MILPPQLLELPRQGRPAAIAEDLFAPVLGDPGVVLEALQNLIQTRVPAPVHSSFLLLRGKHSRSLFPNSPAVL